MAKARSGIVQRMFGGSAARDKGTPSAPRIDGVARNRGPRAPQIDEARRRIAKAKMMKAKELDLGGLGLVEVPEDIAELPWLTRLYLGPDARVRKKSVPWLSEDEKKTCNAMRMLPRAINALRNLRHLDLRGNQLTTLPAEIGGILQAATHVILEYNQLVTLPTDIGNLTSLEELGLGDNQLTSLPAEISHLAALQVLRLAQQADRPSGRHRPAGRAAAPRTPLQPADRTARHNRCTQSPYGPQSEPLRTDHTAERNRRLDSAAGPLA